MPTVSYKCPNCGGQVNYDAATQSFLCEACGSTLPQSAFEAQTSTEQSTSGADGLLYTCPTCGAQLVTDSTTAATECYFCHSAVVLSGRLSGEWQPDFVLPFKIKRQQAQEKFRDWLAGKKFLPNGFFYEGQIEHLTGIYYPFWLADYKGEADFNGEGRIVTHTTTPSHYVTKTDIYRVTRKGNVLFEELMRPALGKADRKLVEGIAPYSLTGLKPFSMPYLSGFFAEKRDIEQQQVSPDIENEVRGYIYPMMTEKMTYSSVTGTARLLFTQQRYRYILLPAWVMTYQGFDGNKYYFAMNAQSGKICGRLPVSKGKLWGRAALIFAAVAALLCVGGYFLW